MTKLIAGATCRDIAQVLIMNYAPDAPFFVEVANREDLGVTEIELIKDQDGVCFLSLRVEELGKRD